MRALLTSMVLLYPLLTLAEDSESVRYISDEISVTLRKAEGMSAEVASLIEAGTRVELLETGSEGYARVRVAPGREGWVLAKYLTEEPSAREQVETLTAKLAERQSEISNLKDTVAEMEQRAAAREDPAGAAPVSPTEGTEPDQKPMVQTLTAAVLVIIGVLLGMIFSQMSRKRRKKWSSEF